MAEKKFSCQVCKKKFYTRNGLNRHKRTIHDNYKPHKCKTCQAAFPTKPALVRHNRTHTGEKPFECSKCGKAFARKFILKRHQTTHSEKENNSQRFQSYQRFKSNSGGIV